MSKQRWMTIIGVGLYLFGIVAGVYLVVRVAMAQLYTTFATIETDRPPILKDMVTCPAVLGRDESGQVKASIPNRTEQPMNYRVDFGVYLGGVSLLTLASSQQITVPPNQSDKLRWTVLPRIAERSALDQMQALTVKVYAYADTDTAQPGVFKPFRSSYSGYCSIWVPAWGTNVVLFGLSLIGMAVGGATWYVSYRPLSRRARIALIAAGVLAALVSLAMLRAMFH
ncbi:MAG: hypothetical protein IT324_20035 [Anaerolineae bacterium]|nr:hypothetical protein [Anaerolineae bacterium]